MIAINNIYLNLKSKAIFSVITLLILTIFTYTTVEASDKTNEGAEQRNQSTITTGSGDLYQTTVERHTEGTLSAQDLHQVSLLASRIVKHINDAAQSLIDENTETAKPEIVNAQKLIKIVKELLPVTTVTTSVKNPSGIEIYRDIDKVQDDKISLYDGMIAIEVVEPIIDAKKEEVALKGLKLADADIIHTSVLADLSYIERKLNRAIKLLDKPDEALAQLALAQSKGIEFVVNKADDPLIEVQHALRLAERMVEEGKYEAAQDNLKLAQIQLSIHRALLDKEAAKAVKQLEDDISSLVPKIKGNGAAEKIRKFWERSVNLFHHEPGEAHVVEKEPEKKTD